MNDPYVHFNRTGDQSVPLRRSLVFNSQKNQQSFHRQGFTLVELLVVISIIALLLGILMPSLSKALGQAKATQCISQMHQLMMANTMYSGENDGFLPFCNSDHMENGTAADETDQPAGLHKWAGAGWLYKYPDKSQPADVENGALWPYLKSRKIYRCPLDLGPWVQVQNLTSYTMNSAIRGFDFWIAPSVKLAQFRGDSLLMWEGDETNKSGGTWNDGNNDPYALNEYISSRHGNRGSAGFADSHAEMIDFETYSRWKATISAPSPLLCNPLTQDGLPQSGV